MIIDQSQCWAENLEGLLDSTTYILQKIFFSKSDKLEIYKQTSVFGDFYLVFVVLERVVDYINYMNKTVMNEFL